MVIINNITMLTNRQQLTYWIVLLTLIAPLFALTQSGTGNLYQISSYNSPAFQCSSFCMYQVNNVFNLEAKCSLNYGIQKNGYCTKCDPLLFRPVLRAGTDYYCIPHQYNGESLYGGDSIPLNYTYGYTLGTNSFDNYNIPVVRGNLAFHFAVRIRFTIYLWNWGHATYIYPLTYSIDQSDYLYNQTLDKYWSPYDLITSPLQNHSANQITISWRLLDQQYPQNNNCNYGARDGTCHCYCVTCCTSCCTSCCSDCCGGGCCHGACCGTSCCDFKYVRVNDLMIFVSLCPTGCQNCTSSTYCTICDYSKFYYLYKADHTCYLTCPQTTYKDNVTLFLNSTVYNQIQHICSECNATCLECLNATFCTKCFAYGRNQSFLYNNSCINPCINGYSQNYTTHVCYCSPEYFYEDTFALICYPCALECVHCYGATNLNCSYCQKGYYLAYQTTHCLIQCPVGQYKSDLTRTCSLCDSTCSDCQQKSTLCTQCYFTTPIKYLLGRQCLTWCPPGYQWNNVTHRCIMCNLYTYSLLGKCVNFCPSMYSMEKQNRSCIHLSSTGYMFELKLVSVSILSHGKLMKFQILAQDGLNATSYQAVIKRAYFNAQVIYKDTMVKNMNGISRNLANQNMPIRNLQYHNNRIIFVTQIPSNLDYRKSFQIVFLETIAGNQNIVYNNITNVYSVSDHPQLMKQYYLYTSKNLNLIIMIPFITILMLLFTLQIKGIYDFYMELLRMVQMLGLLVYSSFPVGKYIFSFLIGCSYANLDFIPNLYAMTAKPESVNNFTSYFLTADDMDFIRLNGSVLFFGLLWGIVIIISKYLIKAKEIRIQYMINFGVDLMEVKILHSFWSALIFVVINYNMTNYSIFATFLFALLLFTAINGRRYSIWRQTKDISPLYIWRVMGTLLFCFVALANELLITLIFCVSLAATLAEFYILHSNKYLININNLNSQNYMSQKTYKILNNYDQQIKYCWSISIRNTIITILPVMTSLFASILILLKESEIQSVIFTSTLIYVFLVICILNSVFIYNFLEERRKYLVQNKLEYLQKKYSKLNNNQTVIYEQRKRPRAYHGNTDDEKYLEINPVRSMMKNID